MTSRDSRLAAQAFPEGQTVAGVLPQTPAASGSSDDRSATMRVQHRDAQVFIALAKEAERRKSAVFTSKDAAAFIRSTFPNLKEGPAHPLHRLQNEGLIRHDRAKHERTIRYHDVVVIAGKDQVWPEAKAQGEHMTSDEKGARRLKPEVRIRNNASAIEAFLAETERHDWIVTHVPQVLASCGKLSTKDAGLLARAMLTMRFLTSVDNDHRKTYRVEHARVRAFLDKGTPKRSDVVAKPQVVAAAQETALSTHPVDEDVDRQIAALEARAHDLKIKKLDKLRRIIAALEAEVK